MKMDEFETHRWEDDGGSPNGDFKGPSDPKSKGWPTVICFTIGASFNVLMVLALAAAIVGAFLARVWE